MLCCWLWDSPGTTCAAGSRGEKASGGRCARGLPSGACCCCGGFPASAGQLPAAAAG